MKVLVSQWLTQGPNSGLLYCRQSLYHLTTREVWGWISCWHSTARLLCCDVLSRLDCLQPVDCIAQQAPLSAGVVQARILEWVAMPSSRGPSNPGMEPRCPSLQADPLPSEPPGRGYRILVGQGFRVYETWGEITNRCLWTCLSWFVFLEVMPEASISPNLHSLLALLVKPWSFSELCSITLKTAYKRIYI